MSWLWLEAALPLGIIAGMLCVMGNSQYYIHKAYHGRPKHIGNDLWDVAMDRRDKKIMEQVSGSKHPHPRNADRMIECKSQVMRHNDDRDH